MNTALAPDPISAGQARRFVMDALRGRALESRLDVAVLLVSELVTNAVLHARGQVLVDLMLGDSTMRVEVADSSPETPVTRNFGRESTTGRGMILLQELADAWGTDIRADGKVVWFELGGEAA